MFFSLSKLFWFVATPSNFLTLSIVAGLLLALATRLRRWGLGLATLGALGLVIGGFSPLANWIILPLEERFPAVAESDGPVDGVVVLGGSFQAGESLARGQATINEAGERIVALADLARRYPAAKLVFSGGAGELLSAEAPEADALKRFLGTFGIPPDRVIFENRSRTTSENAAFSRALAEPAASQRWLLVTSAWHMPRAIGCFRKAGFAVTPYPVDYRTRGWRDGWRGFASVADGLRRLEVGVKEWLGLVGYRLAGYTDEVFPAPGQESPSGSVMR